LAEADISEPIRKAASDLKTSVSALDKTINDAAEAASANITPADSKTPEDG